MFGRVFGGATAYPKAKGIWRDDERGGMLIKDEPIVVHCYTTPTGIRDESNLAELRSFCRKMGREARQGGRVVDIPRIFDGISVATSPRSPCSPLAVGPVQCSAYCCATSSSRRPH